MTAIKEEVLDSEDIAIYIIKKLLSDYPDNIINRYSLTKIEDIVDILDEIGKKIGAFRNSETDYDRVYKRVIKDLQDGYLGKITFDNIN
jgi:ribosome biogenesis GTPase A